jgi:pyruvate dehydrogenase E2 component (dihydrolipoamide acetyltransferase)
MPILGADMVEGTVVEWRKKPGDTVRRGEVIAEIETDKGLIDVEVFLTGVLERILVEAGRTVPTGTVLALIREDGAVAEAPAPAAGLPLVTPSPAPPPARPVVLPPVGPAPITPLPPLVVTAPVERVPAAVPAVLTAPGIATPSARPRVSPVARKRAEQLGVDLGTIRGTGPAGVIRLEDVEHAAAEAGRLAREAARPAAPVSPLVAPIAAPAQPVRADTTRAPEADRHARMRRIIAAAMARAKREIPHYYLATTIDMHAATTWLAAENARRPVTERLLMGVLLIKATALALKETPELNARWDGDRIVPSEAVHVGVAIALRGGGLVAPALQDADRRTLDDLMRGFRDLVQRARTGGIRSSEMSDPTITVTSLGERGVDTVFPIIYPPQVAIVGFGRIAERPWSVGGEIVSRPLVTATLAADHRVSDGHRGGLLLGAIERWLQQPERL